MPRNFMDLEMKAKLCMENINDKRKSPIQSKGLIEDKNKSTDRLAGNEFQVCNAQKAAALMLALLVPLKLSRK